MTLTHTMKPTRSAPLKKRHLNNDAIVPQDVNVPMLKRISSFSDHSDINSTTSESASSIQHNNHQHLNTNSNNFRRTKQSASSPSVRSRTRSVSPPSEVSPDLRQYHNSYCRTASSHGRDAEGVPRSLPPYMSDLMMLSSASEASGGLNLDHPEVSNSMREVSNSQTMMMREVSNEVSNSQTMMMRGMNMRDHYYAGAAPGQQHSSSSSRSNRMNRSRQLSPSMSMDHRYHRSSRMAEESNVHEEESNVNVNVMMADSNDDLTRRSSSSSTLSELAARAEDAQAAAAAAQLALRKAKRGMVAAAADFSTKSNHLSTCSNKFDHGDNNHTTPPSYHRDFAMEHSAATNGNGNGMRSMSMSSSSNSRVSNTHLRGGGGYRQRDHVSSMRQQHDQYHDNAIDVDSMNMNHNSGSGMRHSNGGDMVSMRDSMRQQSSSSQQQQQQQQHYHPYASSAISPEAMQIELEEMRRCHELRKIDDIIRKATAAKMSLLRGSKRNAGSISNGSSVGRADAGGNNSNSGSAIPMSVRQEYLMKLQRPESTSPVSYEDEFEHLHHHRIGGNHQQQQQQIGAQHSSLSPHPGMTRMYPSDQQQQESMMYSSSSSNNNISNKRRKVNGGESTSAAVASSPAARPSMMMMEQQSRVSPSSTPPVEESPMRKIKAARKPTVATTAATAPTNAVSPKTTTTSTSTTTTKKASKASDSLRRPLTAYNFFFITERKRILASFDEDGGDNTSSNVVNTSIPQDFMLTYREVMDSLKSPEEKKKRRHRKGHGKIEFSELSKLVGANWRTLGEEGKRHYKQCAEVDLRRHRDDKRRLEKKTCNVGGVVGDGSDSTKATSTVNVSAEPLKQ